MTSQLLAGRSVVTAADVSQAGVADIKPLDNREAKRSRTTSPHMLIEAEVTEPSRRSEVLLKKPRVLAVGLPGKVKGIANKGNAPEQKIHPDIRDHPSQEDGRSSRLPSVMHDKERNGASKCVAYAGCLGTHQLRRRIATDPMLSIPYS